MRSGLFFVIVMLWAGCLQAFVPTARQMELFDIAVEQYQDRMARGEIARIYETADPSFQVAVSKAEFLRSWDNHIRNFGTAERWNISEIFWYDEGTEGLFAVSELQFLTGDAFVGCGYLVFKETRNVGFRFIRSDTLFVPRVLSSASERQLYAQVQNLPGCAKALDVFP
ncbi:MAG: hypothetical protein AAGJ34_08785 [Pseudomonadota bacterium]